LARRRNAGVFWRRSFARPVRRDGRHRASGRLGRRTRSKRAPSSNAARSSLSGTKTKSPTAPAPTSSSSPLDVARPDAALSLLLVPASTPGVRVRRLKTLGLGTSAMGSITFTRVRVPFANLLGERGAGLSCVQDAPNRERLFGGSRRWRGRTTRSKAAIFARGRRVFGKPITKYQAIRHQFAETATASKPPGSSTTRRSRAGWPART
jgi:alkylation response protein AidB-like acyl-CoA dehydrogenase